MSLLALVTFALAPAVDADPVRGVMAIDHLTGSRLVADAETDVGIVVLGTIDDVLVDTTTGQVHGILVQDAGGDDESAGTLRLVALDDVQLAPSGRRAVATFALTADDYEALPAYEPDEDADENRRLAIADVRGQTLTVGGEDFGAVSDAWIDVRTGRVDFVECAIGEKRLLAPHTAIPWSRVDWTRAGEEGHWQGTIEALPVEPKELPVIGSDGNQTLRSREFRKLILALWGVKEPDTTRAQ